MTRDVDRLASAHVAKKAYRQKILISTLAIILFSTMLILLIVFVTGNISEQKGMFEIIAHNVGNGSISLSNTRDFAEPTVNLECTTIENMNNISEKRDIPLNIEDTDGSHNGANYFAHTFYLKNSGDAAMSFEERIDIVGKFRGAEQAIRVKVYRDGVPATYAAPAKDGAPEYGTVPFVGEDTVCVNTVSDIAPDEIVKYTVVVWLEGDDPECIDDIKGGFVRFNMIFKVINGSDKQADNKE